MPSESEPQPSSVDIYVANSVLHVLYTLSLIRYKQSTNNLVLLLNEFTYAENLVAGINAEFDPASAHLLPGRFDYGAWVARQQRGERSRFVRVIARFVSLFIQLHTKWRVGRLLRSVTSGQVYAEGKDALHTAVKGCINDISGTDDVCFNSFYRIIFAGRHLFKCSGMDDNVDTGKRSVEAILVSYVTDEVAHIGLVEACRAHLMLLKFISAKDDELLGVIFTLHHLSKFAPERTSSSSNQNCCLRKIQLTLSYG